jgi:cytochrome c-type biogenesis protein CcmF
MPAAQDGADLNPVLQDFALAIHPPMLYTGYVGFSVAFAFACAAMLEGRLDQAWAKMDAPLDVVRVVIPNHRHCARQLVGLLRVRLGRLVVLGPGGKRLLHALAGGHGAGAFAERHGKARHLQKLDAALAIFAFSLSLVGTFLVRSGVLVSVHSFATDPTRGLYILAFLVLTIGGSLDLICLACAEAVRAGWFRVVLARVLSAGQQCDSGGRGGSGALGHVVAAGL